MDADERASNSSGEDTTAAAMACAQDADGPTRDKIAFSLSERSFAMFPPLEEHPAAFPKLTTPSVEKTSNFVGTQPSVEQPYPIDLEDCGRFHSPKMAAAPEQVAALSQLMLATARNYPPPPHKHGPIVIVSSYTSFDDLAHGPRGTEARRALRTYRLDLTDGTLTLLSAVPEGLLHNPAFSRRHPHKNIVYACTESVKQNGQIVALELSSKDGSLRELCTPVSAGGTSTCYLTIHKSARRMLFVNYWDSTIGTVELLPDGTLGKLLSMYDPKEGKGMRAKADCHVNHSRNDEDAQAERQGDPHSHAIVLEPTTSTIAYVPDLGMDVIRQFLFDEETGVVTPCGTITSGVKAGRRGLGPRYLIFAKDLPTCYCVNELSSQVAVFAYDAAAAAELASAGANAATPEAKKQALAAVQRPTLTLMQTVSTVPEAFPFEMNTCGRTTLHPSGDFVVTSNRGHDSVAVHRVHRDSTPPGMLTLAGIFHTRGETPRHFQFDKSGQWLLVANQDSNTCAVFAFNTSTGRITYTGNTYSCPSPNFVCVWDGA